MTGAGLWRRAEGLAHVGSADRVVVVRLAAPEAAPRILEDSAALVWSLLDGTRTSAQVIEDAAEVYGRSPSEVAESTEAFLDALAAAGLATRD
jgi:hypothetical protein